MDVNVSALTAAPSGVDTRVAVRVGVCVGSGSLVSETLVAVGVGVFVGVSVGVAVVETLVAVGVGVFVGVRVGVAVFETPDGGVD